jgi:hypothetical protein
MRPVPILRTTAAGLLLAALAAPAAALELTFDPVEENFQPVDQAYGDRVTQTPQDGFSYGIAGGFTPNVEVSYGPIPPAMPHLWTTGYGDLVNVLYEDQDGFGQLEVTFSADPGWRVELHGFDMAAYSTVAPIRRLEVRNGAGDVLFAQDDVAVPHAGHVTFTFDPPLAARWIVLSFDSGNLGSQSDNVCLDNIAFSQAEAALPVEAVSWGRVKSRYR